MQLQDCIFCKIVAGQVPCQKIKETNNYLVIKDINPKASIHYLIIPKEHYPDLRDLPASKCCLMGEMLKIAQELGQYAGDFKIVMNNGAKAGQVVFHAHLHFLAGEKLVKDNL